MNLESCVEQALSLLTAEARTRFASNPKAVLCDDLNLTVTAIEHLTDARADGGACDGMSFLKDGVILYAPTPWSRRENFTLAHELGHWLAEKSADVYDWLADQDEPERLLETVCDRVAQRLLLPEAAVSAVVGSGPIRAQHLIDLYDATEASRPVCAIALAKHVPGLGAIALINRHTGVVTHASVKPDPQQGWPTVFPWREQQLTEGHLLLGQTPGTSTSRRLTWWTPWNAQADFYVDAVSDDRRIIAVFCDSDLWNIEQLHIPIQRDFDTRPVLSGSCCGTTFKRRGYPCSRCRQPFCPSCGDCRCERDAKRALSCTRCFLQFQPHLVVDGMCVDCRS
jgi:hypothetical protein